MNYQETRNDAGQLHSINDQPALIDADGTQFWYRDGILHRDGDKPAIIYPYGSKFWIRDGREYDPEEAEEREE